MTIINDLRQILAGIVSGELQRVLLANDDTWAMELFTEILSPIPISIELKEELWRSISSLDQRAVEQLDERLMLLYYLRGGT